MKRVIRMSLVASLALVAAFATTPASAHTNLVIAGFQISQGGYINGLGVVPNQQIDEGPATDGTVAWRNLDPVQHRFLGKCIARPASGAGCIVGNTYFNVAIDTGANVQITGLLPGTYHYTDAAWSMQGRFRVTGGH